MMKRSELLPGQYKSASDLEDDTIGMGSRFSLDFLLRIDLLSLNFGDAILVIANGRSRGSQIHLNNQPLIIGRSHEADVLLEYFGVSRRQARLSQSPDRRYIIEDLQSLNGTWVNRTRIVKPQVLNLGDRITVGMVRLIFTDTDDSHALFVAALEKWPGFM